MGQDKFQVLWFSGILLGVSGLMTWKGLRVAWRREVDNPLFPLEGARAVALGIGVALVGLAGMALAVMEGLKLR